jgi:hypothetical protein
MPKKTNKIKTSPKPDFLRQTFIHDPRWKRIYQIEDRINSIINETYFGFIVARCEIDEIYALKVQFKINKDNYEYMISKRDNNFGFSIYKLDDEKINNITNISHQTIMNNKFYLYNIYKIMFTVIGVI